MSYIEIKDFSYSYPKQQKSTLKDINLSIESGEILFICGNSGSGKSTIAKCITGSVPDFYGGTVKGDVIICGKKIKDMPQKDRTKEITAVFQDPERQLMMNKVHREIAFGLENVDVEEKCIKRKVWESLQFTDILDLAFRDIKTLSGGEKQKVAIASAVAYMPKCLILDEPTSQLDPAAAEDIVNLVRKINDELGITVIVIEQRVNKWFDLADKVAVMENGKIIFSGNKEEFYKENNEYLAKFLPTYLKLSKLFKISVMPRSFRDAKNAIGDMLKNKKLTSEIEIKKHAKEENAIKVSNVRCSYEDIPALKNIDFSINKGEFIGILGGNGAGKSTLLKSIMGLVRYKGSIKLFGKEVKKIRLNEVAKHIGYVSQNPNDYISKDTVYEEVKFTLDNYNIREYERIDKVLKDLNIESLKDKNPRDISGGERQRLAIASILVLEPDILLLDEPTRGLDREAKEKLGQVLAKLNNKGTTIVMVTHDIEFSSEFCNRFMLMFNGELIADGDIRQVFSNGIYYTTVVNKLFKDIDENVFTLKNALNRFSL